MVEIKIYGEIVSTYARQNGAKGVSLADVQSQLEKAAGEPIKVRINSPGGDVGEGFEIYNEIRRYAQANNVKVHTFGEGMVASVATIIFLSGDTREVSRTMEPFIHNAQWDMAGDSRDFAEGVKVLERWNDRIAKHYSEHTALSYSEARKLMNQDTYITPEEAVRLRFATTVEKVQRPAIIARLTNNQKPINMSTNNKGILAKITALFADAGISNKILYTADNAEVDFYELDDSATPQIGDKANIDGTPADGEVVMSNGETFVFSAGELIEIREAGEDNEEVREDIDALKAELDAAEAVNAALTAKLEAANATIKNLRGTLNTIKNLHSEEVEVKPRPSIKPVVAKGTEKGTRAAMAIEKLSNSKK